MNQSPNIIDAKSLFFEQYAERTMGRLTMEIDLLQGWFRKEFPESRLELNIELNKIKRFLSIRARVLMGQEMVQNRGSFMNIVKVDETSFMDPSFMDEFLRVFNEMYRQEISRTINNHYHREKARQEAEEVL